MEWDPYFQQYEVIAASADKAFQQVLEAYPDRVRCAVGCADCCHALFDLTLVEAVYINHAFRDTFPEVERELLLERANRSDRQAYRIKRRAFKALQGGRSEEEVLEEMARERVRCALLNDSDRCDLYSHRPITCRLYGIPTAIHGIGHTCGRSGFDPGKSYPTARLERIQQQLFSLSKDMVRAVGSSQEHASEMLVPLSMALLTEYDDAWFGLEREGGPE